MEITLVSVDEVRPLLDHGGLPVDDLDADRVEILAVRDHENIVGCVGIERYGERALIRSLIVEEGHRRSGVGTELVKTALEHAKQGGVLEAYGVTTDASAYLSRFGFEEIARQAIVGEIASASQLQGICPDDAVVMRVRLRPLVLFMCVHNAGRSQMAAALLARRAGGRVEVRSAGSEPADTINPAVVEAMHEIGVDLSNAVPKLMTFDMAREADVVVTMGCGDACPVFPGKRYLDWDLPDPAGRSVAEVRAIRDDIERRVEGLVEKLGSASGG